MEPQCGLFVLEATVINRKCQGQQTLARGPIFTVWCEQLIMHSHSLQTGKRYNRTEINTKQNPILWILIACLLSGICGETFFSVLHRTFSPIQVLILCSPVPHSFICGAITAGALYLCLHVPLAEIISNYDTAMPPALLLLHMP